MPIGYGGMAELPFSHTATRVALITGSTSGIGLAIARALSAQGFAIAFHSRSSVEKGRELAASTANSSYTQADLAKEDEVRGLMAQVLLNHGRLDVLVNNAAISATIPHADLRAASPEIWREMYEVNVLAPWILISEGEAALRKSASRGRPSCVLNISSHASVRPKGASIPYAASKAALNHMTKLLARTLGPDIRVNAIAPGLVDTPMSRDWEEARQLWSQRAPMARQAQPQDIAHVAEMLVTNDYLTGEIVLTDGGLNLT